MASSRAARHDPHQGLAIGSHRVSVWHIPTGFVALAPQVVQRIRGTLGDGFALPLRYRAQRLSTRRPAAVRVSILSATLSKVTFADRNMLYRVPRTVPVPNSLSLHATGNASAWPLSSMASAALRAGSVEGLGTATSVHNRLDESEVLQCRIRFELGGLGVET